MAVVKCGGFRYDDGTRYIGEWNTRGQKHGMGHLLLPGERPVSQSIIFSLIKLLENNLSGSELNLFIHINFFSFFTLTLPISSTPPISDGTRYDGCFMKGLCNGLGVMTFPDGAK